MDQPWIYMCIPSRSPLPPPSPSHPSGSSQCTSPEHLSHASNLGWWSVAHFIVYLVQCYSLRTSHPHLLPQSPIYLYNFHMTCIKIILPWKIPHKQLKMKHYASVAKWQKKKTKQKVLSPASPFIQVLKSKYYKLASQQQKVSVPDTGNLGSVCWQG